MDIAKLLPTTNPTTSRIEYIDFIETHLTDILTNHIGDRLEIPSALGAVYVGDFYGLLTSKRMPIDMHYLIMRMNGLVNSADYTGDGFILLVPKFDVVNRLVSVSRTVSK